MAEVIWHPVSEPPPHDSLWWVCNVYQDWTDIAYPHENGEGNVVWLAGRDPDGDPLEITHYAEIHYPEPPKEEAWVAVEPEQAMPRVNGKPFRCECGCNVFTFLAKRAGGGGRYKCSACGAIWEGEPLGPPEEA